MSGQDPVQIRLPEEQMQQFIKLRQEDERLTENLNKVTAQLDVELRNRRTKFITRREISSYPENTRVFQSVGKAFVLDTAPHICETLREDLKKSDDKILKIKKTGIFIVSQRDETNNQISELVKPFMK